MIRENLIVELLKQSRESLKNKDNSLTFISYIQGRIDILEVLLSLV